ncbi:MAG: oligosaccharide repeat unit polymerase, partial [Chitinophagaceae bacterium]
LFITIGAIFGKMMLKTNFYYINASRITQQKDHSKVLNLSIIGLLIIFPFYIQKITELSALSGIDEFWKGLRFQTSSGSADEAGLGVFSYFGAFANFSALIACNESLNKRYRARNAIVLIVLVFVYGIISTARTGVLTLLLGIISIFFVNKEASFARLLTGIIVFLLMFVLPAVFLEKGGSLDSSLVENMISLLQNLQIYALAGIVAFSEVTKNVALAPETSGIFAFFLNLLRAIGINVEVRSSVLDYISTPWPTNVYTIYFPYYVQFGYAGVAIIMTFIGIIVSIFYGLAMKGRPEFVVLNALATAFLMISVFAESFFTALSYWFQLLIFLFFFYRVIPSVHFGRQRARA